MDSLAVIESTTERLVAARGRLKKSHWKLPRLRAIEPESGLFAQFRDQELLIREGHVVWAAVVQNNGGLHQTWDGASPGAPAYVVFSPQVGHESLQTLTALAPRVCALQRAKQLEGEALQRIAEALKDGESFPMNVLLPLGMTAGQEVRLSSLYLPRRHMAGEQLAIDQIPVLMHPDSEGLMLVPDRYWDPGFRKQWLAEVVEIDPEELRHYGKPKYRTWYKISLGMGFLASFKGPLYLMLGPILFSLMLSDYRFALHSEPTLLEPAKLSAARVDAFVESEVEVLYPQEFLVHNRKRSLSVLLVPVTEPEGLYVAFEGLAPTGKPVAAETLSGRIVRESWLGSHSLGPISVSLGDKFEELGIPVPDDLVVLMAGEEPGGLASVLGFLALAMLYCWFVLGRLLRTLRFLRDDEAVAKFEARQEGKKGCFGLSAR